MSLGDDVADLRKEVHEEAKKVAVLWEAYADMRKLVYAVLAGVILNAILSIVALLEARPP